MDSDVSDPGLVEQAQLGSQECMKRLTQLAQGRVFTYIYRLTLDYHLAQDLSQETLLEMVESLKRLRDAHQFWSWLFRTALGKVQHYFRDSRNRKIRQMAMLDREGLLQRASADYNDGLNDVIRKELSEAVVEGMAKLKLRHRSILVLRCFEQMPYSKIANIMACNELQARALFFRAKRSLKRQLSRRGFGKGLLLLALGLFGRMTAPAEAAAETVTVTAAATRVGLVGTLIGAAGSKLGITAATAIVAAALTIGGVAALTGNNSGSSRGLGLNKETFEYPYELLDAHDDGGDGWHAWKRSGTGERGPVQMVPVAPEQWLVGLPPSEQCAVVLPTDHWLELKFRSRIVDGPGDDILLIEWGANGELARVFITDGAGSEYLLGTVRAGISVPCASSEWMRKGTYRDLTCTVSVRGHPSARVIIEEFVW
jgi:RNA polymerase sigma-70 factor (ECF subfamily)